MFAGVEFGARMITIEGKQIKLQIWDTVCASFIVVKGFLIRGQSTEKIIKILIAMDSTESL